MHLHGRHANRTHSLLGWMARAAVAADNEPAAIIEPAVIVGPWRGPTDEAWLRRILRGAGLAPELPPWVADGPAGHPPSETAITSGPESVSGQEPPDRLPD